MQFRLNGGEIKIQCGDGENGAVHQPPSAHEITEMSVQARSPLSRRPEASSVDRPSGELDWACDV